jgi:alginate O-acetyltransferase complex protein AlgI
MNWIGIQVDFSWGQLTLPVGISFYTFHTISYIVDCYRKDVQPTRNFFEFAAYVSLFSQLVAGPIVRFQQLEEDLEGLESAVRVRWLSQGLSLLLTGLVEKTVIADTLATFVNASLAEYEKLSTFGAWMAMLGYTMQLYFDFSGYSTMAMGLGLLFGLRIPQNFNSPYQALNPSDFWKRWHISLSTCMRDYIYIPMGGGRVAAIFVYRNLMLTMLIGGLWHGANWTFIYWGAWHGACLCFYRLTRGLWNKLPVLLQKILTFFMVVVGWVLFPRQSHVNFRMVQ